MRNLLLPSAAGVLCISMSVSGCGGKVKATTSLVPSAGAGGMTIDRTRCEERGKQVVVSDTNFDQKPDVTKLYDTVAGAGGEKTQVLACKQVDLNYDTKVDIVYHHDQSGTISFEEFDLDFDGRFDLWSYYQQGKKVREEMDTNYDRRSDFVKYFESDKLVRVERDTNNDGRVDEWQYYENGKLDRIGYDSTGSGRADKWDRAPDDALPGAASEVAPAVAAPAAPAETTPPPAVAPAPPAKK